jgi:Rrf2 family protein
MGGHFPDALPRVVTADRPRFESVVNRVAIRFWHVKIVPTRRTDYGIRALIYLASHHGERSKSSEIAEAMDIPAKFLHQVLQELQRGQLVTSRPSRSGGYNLTRDPAEISVLDIVEALEGPIRATECALRGGPCHWEHVCALHWVWSSARQALADQLGSATLAKLAEDDRALASGTKIVPTDSHRHHKRRSTD